MFAFSEKGEHNYSKNPTFLSRSEGVDYSQTTEIYRERQYTSNTKNDLPASLGTQAERAKALSVVLVSSRVVEVPQSQIVDVVKQVSRPQTRVVCLAAYHTLKS